MTANTSATGGLTNASGLPPATIQDVKFIGATLMGCSLCIVKIETDQAGLYGYGCASMTTRALAVKTAAARTKELFQHV